jgi:hypothetical protein
MSRRSRPPRTRKSRTPEAPRRDVAVIIPPTEDPGESLVREVGGSSIAPPPVDAELAELDAGWD